MKKDLPSINVPYCTETGVGAWRPTFDRLDVSATHDGHAVLTVQANAGAVVIFDLAPAERDHLVQLLMAVQSEEAGNAA